MSQNKVLLIGNVGNDPEMRYTPNGDPVTDFRMAVNRRWTTADGEQHEETEWFRVTAWRRLAEQVNQYLVKGRRVYVEGRLSSSAYIDREGQARASLDVNAFTVLFLDRAGGAPFAEGEQEGTPRQETPAESRDAGPAGDAPADVEDLPW